MRFLRYACLACIFCSIESNASFIESSIGTAIVEDATATYYNPASLAFLNKKQVVALGAMGYTESVFNGQSTQLRTHFTQSGRSNTQSHYALPSLYYTMPLYSQWALGLALIANDFSRDIEGYSILRYAQSNKQIDDLDFLPALSYQFNKKFSIGAGLNRSRASFLFEPITGFPNIDLPDIKNRNKSTGDAWGWDAGFLIKPNKTFIFGLNHRSAMTFNMHGTSTFNGTPRVVSNAYHFQYWIPARTALSISQAINKKLRVIGTVHYIQWSIFRQLMIFNLATENGIIPLAQSPYEYHNSWLFTAGSNYRISAKWIIRFAGSYLQSPSSGRFQIDNGDTINIGASMAYTFWKKFTVDCSYAYAFIKHQEIHIENAQNIIDGSNKGRINNVALKLTMNI